MSDLYVWKPTAPMEAEAASALVQGWLASGGQPAASPFEPSSDVGWFYRELIQDVPGIDALSDAEPRTSRGPIWLETEPEAPARVVAIRRSAALDEDALETIYALAAKYDLVLFDAGRERIHRPLDAMAAHAEATFWPGGAVQAAVAGGAGAVLAVAAWLLGIPILSGILVVVGLFLALGAVYTFIHHARSRLRPRPTGNGSDHSS